MKPVLICAWVFGLAVAQPVCADAAAQNLVRAAEASRTATYQGVAIYRGGEQLEVFKVQHGLIDGHERERIVSLNGDPVQLLRTDDRVIWVLPKGQTMTRERPNLKGVINQLTADRVQQLASWYRFVDEGSGRIADRSCAGVMVMPRDTYRYGYEVWYDKETRVPLKISLLGDQDEVLEQLMFTEVSFPKSIPGEDFETNVDPSKFSLIAKSEHSLNPTANQAIDRLPSQVSLGVLPPGFEVVMTKHQSLPNGQPGQMEHLLLSDGLASVSVFSAMRPQALEKAFRGISHVGSVRAYGRMAGDYDITIVGEVPSATIRAIGDNIVPSSLAPPGGAAANPLPGGNR